MTLAQYDIAALSAAERAVRAGVNAFSPFYRRFPYRGRLWISEVDMRVAISHSHRFLFNRLPKNANSTVTAMLHAGVAASNPALAGKAPKHAFARPVLLRPSQVDALDGYFRFCIVRDPYTRTLSAFLDKIARRTRHARRPLRLIRARTGRETPGFEDFCLYLAEGGLFDDNHWAPQLHGLVLPLERFDHIGRFENLPAELELISRRIFGAPLADIARHGPGPTRSAELMARHYTPRAREIVAELFAEDFAAFGYPR